MKPKSLKKYIYLSIAASVLTIILKYIAYHQTGSISFFSDALESFVNFFAAVIALIMMHVSEKPADKGHAYGHNKAEYFSSAIEGTLILIAAFSIMYTSISRLIHPQPLENISIGTLFSVIAALINFAVGQTLLQTGKRHNSMILEADGKHLLSDVLTSVGVIAGVLIVNFTDLYILDPLIAIGIAIHIIYIGYKLIARSASGLMDEAMPAQEIKQITDYLKSLKDNNIDYHSLMTRQSGQRRFITFHLLISGKLTVKEGHDIAEEVEQTIENMFGTYMTNVTSHIEPIEDPLSMNDLNINRNSYFDDLT